MPKERKLEQEMLIVHTVGTLSNEAPNGGNGNCKLKELSPSSWVSFLENCCASKSESMPSSQGREPHYREALGWIPVLRLMIGCGR